MIKLNLLIFVFWCVVYNVQGQGRMIRFESSSDLSRVFEQARQENKLVFVDCYTQSCDACRLMEKKVFPKDSVIRFFNENFVNVQVDMGKGEGLKLAEKYGILSFPTYLFLDAGGNVQHEATGYREPENFIAEGVRAMDPERCLSGLKQRYDKGERDVEFLFDYALVLYRANKKEYSEVGHFYLEHSGMKQRYDSGERGVDFMEAYACLLDTLKLYSDLQSFAVEYLSVIPEERMVTTRNWRWIQYYAVNRFTAGIRKVAFDSLRFVGIAGGIHNVNNLVGRAIVQETSLYLRYLYNPEMEWNMDKYNQFIQDLSQIHLPVSRECIFQLSTLDCVRRKDYDGLFEYLEKGKDAGIFSIFSRQRYYLMFLSALKGCGEHKWLEKGIKLTELLAREDEQIDRKEQWDTLLNSLREQLTIQKQALSPEAYDQWKMVEAPSLSDDGKWVTCRVRYQNRSVVSEDDRKPRVIVYNTEKQTSFELVDVNNAFVFADSKWLNYHVQSFRNGMIAHDSVIFMNLQTGEKKLWTKKYVCSQEIGTSFVVWAEPQGRVKKLCVWDILTNDTLKIDSVERYSFYDNSKSIIYIRNTSKERGLYFGKLNGKHWLIYGDKGTLLDSYYLDKDEKYGTFTVASDSTRAGEADLLYTFTLPEGKCHLIWDLKDGGLPDGFTVALFPYVLGNGGKFIFPVLNRRDDENQAKEKESFSFEPELWSWDEEQIPSRPNPGGTFVPEYVYAWQERKWILLTDDWTKRMVLPVYKNSDYGLKLDVSSYMKQKDWKEVAYYDLYLKSLIDGSEQLIARELREYPLWSPDGNYAVVYHPREKRWYSLEVATGAWRVIACDIPFPLFKEDYDCPREAPSYGIAGWMKGREEVILQDKYDLWAVDLTGKKKSVCLTKGAGRNSSCELRLMLIGDEGFAAEQNVFELDLRKRILIKSRDLQTRANAIYFWNFKSGLKKVIEGGYVYDVMGFSQNGKKCIWTRQNFEESPDLWCGNSDFSGATRVTRANAQQDSFNWGSVKIVRWTSSVGKKNEGLLYLPENFTPGKAYPAIVTFYERESDKIHYYWTPQLSNATINIPTYVSQGYVVFVPDIHYTLEGDPGEDCFDAVVSGTEMLIKEGIIDRARVGVQGHSWGGFQTVYLLTRTNLFRCGQPGAAVVNAIAAYTALRADGSPRMYMYEDTQSRIGKTLWEAPEKYLKSSSILRVDKISCPLLILHNDADGAVPFAQGLDLFLAMRRLHKPAWLVNYRGENHFLSHPAARKDWSIRLQQFFDYYLKDGILPPWMKEKIL